MTDEARMYRYMSAHFAFRAEGSRAHRDRRRFRASGASSEDTKGQLGNCPLVSFVWLVALNYPPDLA